MDSSGERDDQAPASVQTAESVQGDLHNGFTTLRARYRVTGCHGYSTSILDLGDDLFGDEGVCAIPLHRTTEVVDHHRRASTSEFVGIESPESSSRSRDDHRLSIEADHSLRPPSLDGTTVLWNLTPLPVILRLIRSSPCDEAEAAARTNCPWSRAQ